MGSEAAPLIGGSIVAGSSFAGASVMVGGGSMAGGSSARWLVVGVAVVVAGGVRLGSGAAIGVATGAVGVGAWATFGWSRPETSFGEGVAVAPSWAELIKGNDRQRELNAPRVKICRVKVNMGFNGLLFCKTI